MISVTLHRKTLVRLDACEDGIALFDQIAAMQPASDPRRLKRIRVVRWTLAHQCWLLVGSPAFCEWMRRQGLIPWIPMERADLRGADLRGADLQGAYLQGACLRGADLRGADLRGACLQGARAHRPDGDPPDGWMRNRDGYLERAT
jgi:hypothetical protein